MVAQTAHQARANARRYTTCDPGQCLKYTRTWLEIDSRYDTAAEAWHAAERKHPGDRHPPPAAPVFWLGGSRGFGHVGLSMLATRHTFRGTDMPSAGLVSTQDLSWVDENWGASQDYAGWSEDLNGVLIPYLDTHKAPDWRAHGDVYLNRLREGVQDSDSVARLRYRLQTMDALKGSGHRPGYGQGYGPETVEAVRWWQRNPGKRHDGPSDGRELSGAQADALLGDRYDLFGSQGNPRR